MKRVNSRPNRGGGRFNARGGGGRGARGDGRGRGRGTGAANGRGGGRSKSYYPQPREKLEMSERHQDMVQDLLLDLGVEDEENESRWEEQPQRRPQQTSKRNRGRNGGPKQKIGEKNVQRQEKVKQELLDMGFDVEDVEEALQRTRDKESALDWLCLHLVEEDLPAPLQPASSSRYDAPDSDKVVLEFYAFSGEGGRGTSDTGSTSSAQNDAASPTFDTAMEEAIIRLSKGGFSREECIMALKKSNNTESEALKHLLHSLLSERERQQLLASSKAIGDEPVDEEEAADMLAEECIVLNSIFGEECFTKTSESSLYVKFAIDEINPEQTENELYAYLGPRYPFEPPHLLYINLRLSATTRKKINQKLAEEAYNYAGEAMIYSLVVWLQGYVPELWAKEQQRHKGRANAGKQQEKKNANQEGKEENQLKETFVARTPIERTLMKLEQQREKELEEERRSKQRMEYVLKLIDEEDSKNEEERNEERERRREERRRKEQEEKEQQKRAMEAEKKRQLMLMEKERIRKEEERQIRQRKREILRHKYMERLRGFDSGRELTEEEKERDHERIVQEGNRLKNEMEVKREGSKKYQDMQKVRQRLPAFNMKDAILKVFRENQVVVISGETGCGKTTQIPQFILDEMIDTAQGGACNIVCTQPRRLSAIAVAERVADERAEAVGRTVGYHIRLEWKKSRDTRLLFCTTGVLLRRLQADKMLHGVSHIIVDEIHERDINSDFLLIILKDLIQQRQDLKLVLMSATLNAEMFSNYFNGCPVVEIPGFTHPVTEFFLEDALEMTRHRIEPGSKCAKKEGKDKKDSWGPGKSKKKGGRQAGGVQTKNLLRQTQKEEQSKIHLKSIYGNRYSTATLNSLEIVDESEINYDLLEDLIWYICDTLDRPAKKNQQEDYQLGAILVFLPGLMEITTLYEQLMAHPVMRDRKRFIILPLHSTLSTMDQHLIFDRPSPGVRKIVIATNIAETSITIDDVVFVLDSGKVKEKRYESGISSLVETWISRANARQRKGRAGRVQPGVCFHLFTSVKHQKLRDFQLPEMLRVPLEELALQIRFLELGSVAEFLSKAIEAPPTKAIAHAVRTLIELNALEIEESTQGEELTPLGYHLATLPVEPRIGKMMLFGAIFGCIDPVLTIAASLSFRSPFVSPIDKRDEADEAKKKFARGLFSDHLALLKAFNGWKQATKSGFSEHEYCRMNFLSLPTLRMIADMKKEFKNLLKEIGFLGLQFTHHQKPSSSKVAGEESGMLTYVDNWNKNAENMQLLRAVICAGLYPNVVKAQRHVAPVKAGKGGSISWKLVEKKGADVAIHPTSTLFGLSSFDRLEKWLIYHEKVKTTKVYLRDGTLIGSYPLCLFGGSLNVVHAKGIVVVDDWIEFTVNPKVGVMMKKLRSELDKLLLQKIESPESDIFTLGQNLLKTIIALISSERR
ncbi:DEAH (Asp-Glu-Ala-Asp/His) box polypeptide 57 [Balamuthia mandrillaris]